LAAVTTEAEVADIRAEWEDRYGPVPPTAAALLDVARLRAECVRTGIREINVGKGPGFGGPAYIVRLSPLELKVSQEVRLARLVDEAVYKVEAKQLQLPVRRPGELVEGLLTFLRQLIPPDSGDDDSRSNVGDS
jgi:transcription-repair coupling factor (superfamily II helicase)